ncbi:MAG: PH domain-containing protein [bacterium]|nr:PH domain-containing protein [bacterium]
MIKSLFSILRDSPNSFEGQEKDEKVILLLRRHLFVILLPLALFVLACLVPIVLGVIFWSYLSAHSLLNLYFFVSSVWFLSIWFAIFYSLTMYTLNTIAITDHRIVNSDQHGFFNRQISELHSHRIQDVSIHTNGLIETVLKFGDITVQTAATEKQFVFHQIPRPDRVKDVIMQIARTRDSGVKAELR